MRFYVVDPLIPQWQMDPQEATNFPNCPTIKSAMWIPFPRSMDADRLDFFIANTCPPLVLRSDVAIVGLHPTAARVVKESDDILDDVAARIEDAPLYIVYHSSQKNNSLVIEHVRGNPISRIDTDSVLDFICQQDIAQVIRRPGTELPEHTGLHYQGPNGDHYRAFSRPGFAARSVEELDRFAFWMMPFLEGKNCFLVDHSSMMLIPYHIGQYAREFGREESISVQSLRTYSEPLELLIGRLKSTFGKIRSDAGAILISVNSSGRLARNHLLPAMKEVGFDDPTCIAIARTPNAPDFSVKSLTTLGMSFERSKPSDCEACKQGSVLVGVQNDSYLLKLAAYVQSSRITKSDASSAADVVNRYRGIGAFRTHVTHSSGRHHAYYVDLIPMLNSDHFQQRLTEYLRAWSDTKIDVIIHAMHPAGDHLASMVAKRLSVDYIIGSDESFRNLTDHEKSIILKARRVCVVDDVVVTGGRLLGYRNNLNDYRRRNDREDCELHCVVGVSRTTSSKAAQGIEDILGHSPSSSRFLSVERLYLPCWDEAECSWCGELDLLEKLRSCKRLPSHVRDLEVVRDRIEVLKRDDGITEDLFVPWNGSNKNERIQYWKLGPHSIFGEVQGADLAVSVAATIQSLRDRRFEIGGRKNESKLDEVFRSPVSKVLDPEFYIGRRFYDRVLVASILRALKPHDIVAPGQSDVLHRQLDLLMKDDSDRGLWGELVLAMALKQIPVSFGDVLPKCYSELAAEVGPLRSS